MRVDEEYLHFTNVEQFKEWKSGIEKLTITCFRQRTVKQLQTYTLRTYMCHRSGKFQPKSNRTRRLKTQGSKKINGYCPAEMKVSTDRRDGTCKVTYIRTHLGHNVGDLNELVHITLSREERLDIAAKISDGTPYGKILDETTISDRDQVDRLSLLSNKDLHNIAATFGLKYRPCDSATDLLNAETFVSQNPEWVVYYKRPNQRDLTHEMLQQDELMVVLMSPTHKDLMGQYRVVAMDGTHRAKEYSFFIHVIVAVDDQYEALVLAVAVTNRNNHRFIDVFLDCIKKEIGNWQTRLFLSGARSPYQESWLRVMAEPTYKFRCVWNVRDVWQQNLCKITNGEKRLQMQQFLDSLLATPDKEDFYRKLEEMYTNTDPDLENFLRYFRKHYYQNLDNWAYCYRQTAGDANVCVEAFSRIFKHLNSMRTKARSLSPCLYSLKRYMALKEKKMPFTLPVPKYSNKLRILRQRHDEIEAKNLETIVMNNDRDDSWFVSVSGSEEGSVYFVSATNNKCQNCGYYCEICKACYHMYECSCMDFTIKGNMCKHVHGLCMFLKNVGHEAYRSPNDVEETFSLVSEAVSVKEILLDLDYSDEAEEFNRDQNASLDFADKEMKIESTEDEN